MPPGKVMSIDSVKINPSLVMMRECVLCPLKTFQVGDILGKVLRVG